MSTILKALRRLEEDRNPLGTRPLRQEVTTPGQTPERSRRTRVALFSVLAIGVAGGAGVLAFLSAESPAPQPAALTPAPSRPAARPALAAAAPRPGERPRVQRDMPVAPASRQPDAVQGGLPPAALSSDVKVVSRPPPVPRLAETDPEPEAPPAVPRATSRPGLSARREPAPQRVAPVEPPVARVAKASPPPAPTPVSKPTQPSAEPAAASPPAPAPAVAAAAPAPTAPAAPPIARALVPEVRVEQTRWHPDAARRSALVEVDGGSREVHQGDAVGPLVVSTIEPSGVVFTHDGVELRRRIGE